MFYWQGGKFQNYYFLHIRRGYLQYTWPKTIILLPCHCHSTKIFNFLHDQMVSHKHTTKIREHTLILGIDTSTGIKV